MKAAKFDFKGAVEAMLRELGAVDGDRWYILRLDTAAGPLDLCPQDNWLACRFVDVDRAWQVLGKDPRLNGFSGKWNFHPDVADADAVIDIRHRIEQRLLGVAATGVRGAPSSA
jgi:hypothetical protein